MEIGTLKVEQFTNREEILNKRFCAMSTGNSMLYVEMAGNYMQDLNLQKNVIYTINCLIDGESTTTFTGTFVDYNFHAGSSDYIDMEGNHVTGNVVLSNRLQFQIIA